MLCSRSKSGAIAIVAASLVAVTAGSVSALDASFGEKDWTNNGYVHAIACVIPVPNSWAWGWDELHHAMWGQTPYGDFVQMGYATHNWLGTSYRDYWCGGKHRSRSEWEDYLGNRADVGANHLFVLIWDNNRQKYSFQIDNAEVDTSGDGYASGFSKTRIGAFAHRGSGQTGSDTRTIGSLNYARLSEWWWHGTWPGGSMNPVTVFEWNGGLGATRNPSDYDFSSVTTWDN